MDRPTEGSPNALPQALPPWTVERFTITTQTHGNPLICTMNKYIPKHVKDPFQPGIILLLGHGIGFFKETWEPVLEDLYKLDALHSPGPKIREAFALDLQSHGEAGVLNENILANNEETLNIWDYADAFATLLKSDLLGPIDPNFHQVVPCGHSAGSVGVTLSTSWFNPPSRLPITINSIILVDPPIWSRAVEENQTKFFKMVAATTPSRKDTWKSKAAARDWLKARPPWKGWEGRLFDIFTTHGLRPLPTAHYPESTSGVTLTTHRLNENVAYVTALTGSSDALNRLNQICAYIPVHLIYGDKPDMFGRDLQDSLLDEKEGRLFASIARISGAGHLVPQQAPEKLAVAIFDALCKTSVMAAQSRL